MSSVTLEINGQPVSCEENILLPELLDKLGFNPRLIVVEYNGEILHRQYWSETRLSSGDRLEVVTIVGGGLI